MSAGIAYGAYCYPDLETAASLACSAKSGITGTGSMSCTGYTLTGSQASFTLQTVSSSGAVSQVVEVVPLQNCERHDLSYFAPIYAALILAMVSIWGVRQIKNLFSGPSEV